MSRQLRGFQLEVDDRVYRPAEDSLLLADCLEPPEDAWAVDLCTGAGLAALELARGGARTLATDVNPHACRLARENAHANGLSMGVVRTDLAAGLEHRFEAVACNPPYLPTQPGERVSGPVNRALDGGADGADVARRAIDAFDRLLSRDGRAWLVVSSLQPVADLRERARARGLTWQRIVEEDVGRFEKLAVVHLQRADRS